jgi:alpha-glucosidase
MLLLTLRGTPTMYYGDELGMQDVTIPPERVQDPFEKNVPGIGVGRDPARTPMQWSASRHAGFSAAEPWLPVAEDHARFNVATEDADPASMLTLYRRLIALRRKEPALITGSYMSVAAEDGALAYIRQLGDRRLLVALNLGARPYRLALPSSFDSGHVLLSTHLDHAGKPVGGEVDLRADEGVIVELAAPAV